ncbi:MAG: hypothetical protein SFW07_05615 [Gammaproteobacteria bacterium]|nr:hypothetical protein [Gammaproteobacteria bacterium]
MEENTQSLSRSIGDLFSSFRRNRSESETPSIELSEKKPLIIGISDIDHTLVFTNENDINDEEIGALLQYNITRLLLATDMSFTDDEMRLRLSLETHLKKRKIELLGIISTSDYAWHLPTDVLKKFYDLCHTSEFNIDFKLKKNLDKLTLALEQKEFAPIKELMKGNATNQAEPGTAYSLAKQQFGKDERSYQYLKERAIHAKWVVDTICSLSEIPRPGLKGLILRPLFTNPRWTENRTFVYFDDKEKEVEDATIEINALNIRASAFLSPLKKEPTRTKEYYIECIETHCKKYGVTKNPSPKESFVSRRRANSSAESAPSSASRTPSSLSSHSSSDDIVSMTGEKPAEKRTLKLRMSSTSTK